MWGAGSLITHAHTTHITEAAPTDNGEQKQQTPVAPAMTLPKLEQAEAAGATAGAGNGYGVEEDEAGEEEPPV